MSMFEGLSAFPITPADADGRVDAAALGSLVARLAEARVGSVGLLGSTGLYPFFERAERRRAVEAAVAASGGRVPLLVGIGALRTADAVRFGRDAREEGADAVLLAPVSYTPLTAEEVFRHVETVAGEVGLPVCVYDNPATTHFTFTDALWERLGQVPGVAAVKTTAPDGAAPSRLAVLRGLLPPSVSIGWSADWRCGDAMIAGADAWYSVAAGLFPGPCLAIAEAARAGRPGDARALDRGLSPLWDLFTELSSLRVMYAAAKLLGLTDAVPPRPILPLGADDARRIADVIRRLSLEGSDGTTRS